MRGIDWAALLAGVVTANIAAAQFPGDLFFAEPSVAAEPGETVALEVEIFTGTSPLGAVLFDVTYDPNMLEVIEVSPGGASEFRDGFRAVRLKDRWAVVAMNGDSLERPFGTISLARITVRPKSEPGQTAMMELAPRRVLATSLDELDSRGFSASIAVVSPDLSSAKQGNMRRAQIPVLRDPTAVRVARRVALRLRPAGNVRYVILPWRQNALRWSAVRVPVLGRRHGSGFESVGERR